MLKAIVAVPQAPVRVPSQRPLFRSVTSVTSVANDRGDNEMIPGDAHSSPSIFLTAEENPGKPQHGDRMMKGLCDLSLPQMRSVGSHRKSGREMAGKKERTGRIKWRHVWWEN